ncbi:hypothetical protein QR680_000244 [Steinernema hermaphroditum]|uniref:Uncharacterized protein n=1 Tax=Steinernema hermaphroditum TaxID=289476 RepID=A0AA39GUQ9_9BILA|nr:hypothetical protein QR680_000244 [Steinernema hermaphroditum]
MEPRRGPPFPLNEGEDYNNMTVREYNNRLVDYYAATLPRRPITNRSSPRSNQSPIADRSPAPLTPDEQAPLPPLLTLQNDLPAEQPNNSRPGPNPISQQARNRYTNQQGAIRPSYILRRMYAQRAANVPNAFHYFQNLQPRLMPRRPSQLTREQLRHLESRLPPDFVRNNRVVISMILSDCLN